ncbi:putative secreted protein [Propionispora sp. 2/2-37]|uniref:LysR family transcriptional regulator n=1 Tax=Propionispora sp. 2/2-37 TaxID=1677858 RepID=UPI0006BB61D6|nr:LysR family transcriptional regulator [Propionispora sp. 2/2-37]CUH96015.1 putative secreted protein [Propionispora sp. 2/2-37]
MDLRLLKSFLLVAKLLNITKAAEQLGFSQPAVTAQIYSLEEAFHVRLFKRNGKRLSLTEAGSSMITYAERLVSLWEETRNVMCSFEHSTETIRLGVSTQMINYFLPDILAETQSQMPQTCISIEVCMSTQKVLEGILEHRYDLGFIHGDNSYEPICQHGIWIEDVLWVASSNYIKNHSNKVNLSKDLLINYTKGTVFRQKFDETVGPIELQSPIEYSDSAAIKRAVIAGLGISYLPGTLVREEIERGVLGILEQGPRMQLKISLIHHQEQSFSLPMYSLLCVLAQQADAAKSLKDLIV